ncbi:isochorismate synthase MenF, partial [Klebsiella pneumoniae]
MLSVSTALARLQDGLGESFPDLPGTRIIDVAFPLNDAFDPLLWCGQQAQWPQFYWQQRNGDEELATLGAVKTFTSLDAANRFLRQVGRQDLRICGLNAFEPQQGSLALPRRHCCKVSDEAAFCLIQRPYISKTLLT